MVLFSELFNSEPYGLTVEIPVLCGGKVRIKNDVLCENLAFYLVEILSDNVLYNVAAGDINTDIVHNLKSALLAHCLNF